MSFKLGDIYCGKDAAKVKSFNRKLCHLFLFFATLQGMFKDKHMTSDHHHNKPQEFTLSKEFHWAIKVFLRVLLHFLLSSAIT